MLAAKGEYAVRSGAPPVCHNCGHIPPHREKVCSKCGQPSQFKLPQMLTVATCIIIIVVAVIVLR
jgi:uncharacterized paraquat-inducible protein A